MSDFQGIQGSGGNAYSGPYTWGGTGPRRIVADHSASDQVGLYRIRDDYDGAWISVRAGEMVPLTDAVRAAKDSERIATRADLRALAATLDAAEAAVRALLRGA